MKTKYDFNDMKLFLEEEGQIILYKDEPYKDFMDFLDSYHNVNYKIVINDDHVIIILK